ncbi:aminopeptidase N [Methylotetracoccus oryzae]|uniref:aminopeptidase N n=1 Tax=Methylotetracoccus oryzae TaxID=1919059 RepID=UPI001117B387|nr:aminopeptidase N [Methylotetracoccus oryzae]
MREATPQAIYLKDYTPPDYLIDTVDLAFDLEEADTRVTSRLAVRRNPAGAGGRPALELAGEQLVLESVQIDGRLLAPDEFTVGEESLVLSRVPDVPFVLEVVTRINPGANTALEGLYASNGMLCTQCEAQGFRRITYFLDRPDVMARYTATLTGDRDRYPVLLCNGNRVEGGELPDGRHWVRWEDPFKKPSYLFALVAGRLDCIEDRFTTMSGRSITLQIFVEAHDRDKCSHAMESLQRAMRWDEECFGREYDLDLYMIVAVGHFNMGAMENKGLNIFNTKYVLARPDTATDADYEHIQGVIAHEYFHNWTGNRITCRDWFQLSLKEGLTVFRDQEFTADHTSRGVKRIDDVNQLRIRQFAEDAGPLSHPVRPESYIEINNFYTLTVYEKGAEVVRMIQTLLGSEGFRKGCDLYFARHDGQAVTCEDFVRCMEDATGVDLAQFRRWYSQAGTPELHLEAQYDAKAQALELTVRQSCPATPGQPVKQPFHIPLALGLVGPDGTDLPVILEGEGADGAATSRVLSVTEPVQRFRFVGLPAAPVLSPLRGFSAPVRLHMPRSEQELAFLLAYDSDMFNRWDAAQELAARAIIARIHDGADSARTQTLDACLVDAMGRVAGGELDDRSYWALLLTLPSEDYVSSLLERVDPDAVHAARQGLRRRLADDLGARFERLYAAHHRIESGPADASSIGRRRLKNVCLGYLMARETDAAYRLCSGQFDDATNMTDQIAALTLAVNSHHPERGRLLERFYEQWRGEALVIDKWFALQASCSLPDTLTAVVGLLQHPDFDLKVPNRVRSLIGMFSQANPVNFHARDGRGYEFLADHVIALNALNPQIAARLAGALTQWRRYDEQRAALLRVQLQRIAGTPGISKDVYEVASKGLA